MQKKTALAVLALTLLAIPATSYAQGAFTPLTNLPGLSNTLGADSLPNLLNQIYRLCIGAAAVIAVLQIIRAGAQLFFNTSSVGQNKEAKNLIRNSLLGLLLVLSPAIVFGIINPDILDLSLDFSRIQPSQVPADTAEEAGRTVGQQLADIIQGGYTGDAIRGRGTVLRTSTFTNEAALNAFIANCSSDPSGAAGIRTPGIAHSRGCTRTCSPAGSATCNQAGCSEYTGYCSIPQVFLATHNGTEYVPHSSSQQAFTQFQASCRTDGGRRVEVRGPLGQGSLCPGSSYVQPNPQICYQGMMVCNP